MSDVVDRLGRFFEKNGLPRMAGRVMGYLLVCSPPEQTFDELVAAVGASRSSVSVASQLLLRLELIERFGVTNDRRDRYRLSADAWTVMLRQDVTAARELKQLAERGLRSVKGRSQVQRERLQEMREFYAFLEESLVPLLAAWDRRRAAKTRAGESKRRSS